MRLLSLHEMGAETETRGSGLQSVLTRDKQRYIARAGESPMLHAPVGAPGTPTFTAMFHPFYHPFMPRSSALYTLVIVRHRRRPVLRRSRASPGVGLGG